MIKAIQTLYSGIWFRSRLEARWAMYFDLLGVEWIYEMEGFKVGRGEFYLPDFFLPKLKYYCEVKPFEQTDPKWAKFVGSGESERLLLLFGKVHCLPYPVVVGNGLRKFVGIPHSDSDFAPIYYPRSERDFNMLVEENQVFCDEANSYRFGR